ncbi:MAG: transglutaminase-like domain-containing protein [Candidatus Omnitrophica bacterium]|nr:transglutaminase-like domain-containing protein [Candidatus Omnitrophota bacterium]
MKGIGAPAGTLMLFLGAGSLLFSFPDAGEGVSSSERSFHLRYEAIVGSVPSDAKRIEIWIPLATSNERQTIMRRIIESPVPYQITRDGEYGNEILYVNVQGPIPAGLKVAVEYDAFVQGGMSDLKRARAVSAPADEGLSKFLKPTTYMKIDERVTALSQSITAGAPDPVLQARRIYDYVIERMTYEKETPGWGRGDTMRACELGTGNCTDFHSLFISLAQASRIPAKFQIGLPLPDKEEGEIPSYHCWAQFYAPSAGWVPVDASEAWKNRQMIDYFFGTYDPNRLALSTGRDIQLVPKPANGPVNIFFFPHVEIDGKVAGKEQVKTKFQFRNLSRSEA